MALITNVTLPSLLWTALGSLECVHISAGVGTDGIPSLDQWSNLLRAIDPEGVDTRKLATTLRLSKRAVRSRISAALRRGWIEELTLGTGNAGLRLTARGSDISAMWEQLQQDAEERWRTAVGRGLAHKLRDCLEVLVSLLPLEHSHYPASYGPADASITGSNGQDWKAVLRAKGDTVSYLPLTALLSQPLVAFAIAYEEKSPVALSLSANMIVRIPPSGMPFQKLGRSTGLSALARHGFLSVSETAGCKLVVLTRKGCAVRDHHHEWIEAVETEWHNRYGRETVTALRHSLEAVAEADSERRYNTASPLKPTAAGSPST